MFGYYNIPFRIVKEEISISIEEKGESLLYMRKCLNEKVERILLMSNGKIILIPIEPLNKPKKLTPHLLIEFEKDLMIEPGTKRKIFLKFPVEIGVFISDDKNFEILDILTLVKQKFTLYGDIRSGYICRYWKSEVYSSMPSLNTLHEGVVELNITNTTSSWLKVTKAVFDAYGMKIYYSDDIVSMRANMKIINEKMAEIDFVDSPLKKGMEKSLEVYVKRKPSIIGKKFVMVEGI